MCAAARETNANISRGIKMFMPASDVRSSMCLPLISLRFPLERLALARLALFRSARAPGRSRAYSEHSRSAVSELNLFFPRPQWLHSPSGRRSRGEGSTASERKKQSSAELNDGVGITSARERQRRTCLCRGRTCRRNALCPPRLLHSIYVCVFFIPFS